jgi:hypothetical protein
MLPFEGVRVLEVAAWTFVPAAGAALADLGADVIKIEPPAGDPQRGLMNLLARAGGAGANPFVEIPNRGKQSVTLDLAQAEGHALLLELAATADVFLTSYLPEVRARLGIGLDDLRAVNPQIGYTSGCPRRRRRPSPPPCFRRRARRPGSPRRTSPPRTSARAGPRGRRRGSGLRLRLRHAPWLIKYPL